jgi:undecaprenyl-diphosphatase
LPIDSRTLAFTLRHRSGFTTAAARVVSHAGDPVVLVAVAAVAAVWLLRRHSAAVALAPMAALLAGSAAETIVKHVVNRPRPPVVYHLVAESNASFPSGHTTGAAALLVALALVVAPDVRRERARPLMIGGLALLAAVIGAARLELGVHWLSDVVAGWFFGTAWALGLVLVAQSAWIRRRTPDVAPAVTTSHRSPQPPPPTRSPR